MKKVRDSLGVVQNASLIDRIVRLSIGGALISVATISLSTTTTVVWETYAILLAIYPLMTGMLGWDPIYSMTKIKTCHLTGRNQCGTLPYEMDAAMGHNPKPYKDYDHSLAGSHR